MSGMETLLKRFAKGKQREGMAYTYLFRQVEVCVLSMPFFVCTLKFVLLLLLLLVIKNIRCLKNISRFVFNFQSHPAVS